ncbi:2-hydroxyacid dehydrogenase [Cellulomonas citrea]|uniref:2-hydroxyacid dehydrogenase n=1 Tax=Cellulomonas citrea TaxID=1909423 RepID=UPI00135821A4|nr:2-hydroxyacid dehydrogenase [Cellulomonas citrea]
MLTVTVPDEDLLDRLSGLADRVELVRWDLRDALDAELAARVSMVVIGHYWTTPDRYTRLRDLPNLRYVQLPSAGFEHALPHVPAGVTVCNGRGVHSAGTAELAVGLVLAAQRGLVDAARAMTEGRWANPELPSLADRRVLLVGAGSVAEAVAARLAPFEVQLTQVARTARGSVRSVADLDVLLPQADVVVLTVPLDRTTYHLLDARRLALLPDGALVVNVARGKVLDTQALLAELSAGRLRAALDVTDPEPLPSDHPLWHAPNLLITAHQGGNSDATYPRVAALVARQLENLLAGREPENVVART